MQTLLIVDDDLKLRTLLKKYLLEQNFIVIEAANTSESDRLLKTETVDLMVLDLMMPTENGLDYCKRLRKSDINIPIIMLSARGEDIDKIIGLEMGMDDYMSKPFNPRELLARIRTILRRPKPQTKQNETLLFRIGDLQFDKVKRHLIHQSGETTALTSTEYNLLKAFAENVNVPLSRDKIMRLLHSREFDIFDRSIDVLVSRLRKLVERDPKNPQLIKTVWGVGYVFVAESSAAENQDSDA